MNVLKIRIGDVENKEPLFPELQDKLFKEIKVVGCAILEKGTSGGNSSLFIHGFEGDTTIAFQLTENMFNAIGAALRGAKQRWAEKQEKKD